MTHDEKQIAHALDSARKALTTAVSVLNQIARESDQRFKSPLTVEECEAAINEIQVAQGVSVPADAPRVLTPEQFDEHFRSSAAQAIEQGMGGVLFELAMDLAPHTGDAQLNVIHALALNERHAIRQDKIADAYHNGQKAIDQLRRRGVLTVETAGRTHEPVVVLSVFGMLLARELNMVSLAALDPHLPDWLKQTS